MPTVFLDVVFKLFFKIIHDTGQELTIDRTNFLTDGSLQIIQHTGFVSVNTRFQIPPKEKKSHVERSGERGGHGTSPKREMRCSGNMFRTMVIDSFAVCAVAPSCRKWPTQRKRMPTTSYPPRPTYWVLPIQKMPGSRGSLCITFRIVHFFLTVHVWNVEQIKTLHFGPKGWEWLSVLGPNE